MYLPEHFEETQPEELRRIMAAYPLGAFVVNGPNGLDANHLPFELRPGAGEHGQLLAHVARANPVWKEIQDGMGFWLSSVLRMPTSHRTGIPVSTSSIAKCPRGTTKPFMFTGRCMSAMTNDSSAVSWHDLRE